MKIGLITDSVGHLPFESALDLAKEQGLSSVEVATGNWSEAPHADLPALVSSAEARAEFAEKISSRGLTLSALCANGNQLHPVEGPEHDKVVRNTIALASNLEVPTVVLMSGLPGARGDSTPNWITTSWPPRPHKVLDYQWNEVATPTGKSSRRSPGTTASASPSKRVAANSCTACPRCSASSKRPATT